MARGGKTTKATDTGAERGGPSAISEIGAPGLEIYGGRVSEEFLPELSGVKAARVYREMAHNSATVGAILFAIRMMMRQVEWRIRPASKAPEDEGAAEILRTRIHD